MTERNKLTPSELDKVLALYQSLITLVIFFAGFVFVTIPLIIFSADVSHQYGRLVLYCLLTSLVIYATIIDLYHANHLQAFKQTIPHAFPVLGKYRKAGLADLLMVPAQFFAFASISFMLLLKGPEFTVDAFLWILVTIGRLVVSSYVIFGVLKKIK